MAEDAVLWERWQGRRDADAFAELVARHSGMVYATCRRVLGNTADAEDAAQECFLELMRARVRVGASLAPWLHTVAVRRALDALRSEKRRRQRHEQLAVEPVSTAETDVDLLAAVDDAIAALPDRFRIPVILRFLEGRTHEAIAERLNLSESTVRYRLEKGIERIRVFLSRRGLAADGARVSALLAGLPMPTTPPGLIPSLGRHMLAQAGITSTASVGVTVQLIGGMLVMKKLAVGVAIMAALAAAFWWVEREDKGQAPSAAPESTASQRMAAVAAPEADTANDTEPEAKAALPEPVAATATAESPAPDTYGIPVRGRVVDRFDQPVPGAQVGAKRGEISRYRTESKADGSFEIFVRIVTNDLLLQARKDGYESALTGPLKLRHDGLADIVLRLDVSCSARVAGELVDSSGEPVADQRLWFDPGRGRYVLENATATTDAKGAFSMEGLGPGQYGIVPVSGADSGFLAAVLATVELKPGQAVRDLRLVYDGRGGRVIAGRVIDRTGAPVEDAAVSCHNPMTGFARSDAEGRFRMGNLPEGSCVVSATHEKHAFTAVQSVQSGTEDLEIVMSDFGSVEGQVVRADTGEPVAEFEVFRAEGQAADHDIEQYANHHEFLEPEGRFTLTGLVPGRVRVTVRANGFAPLSQFAEVSENQTQSLRFALEPGTRIEGRVTDSAGRAIAGAYIFPGPLPLDSDALAYYTALTDAEGRFAVEHAAPGLEQISAVHPDYASATVDVTHAARIVLPEACVLEGVVTENGQPVAGVPVIATMVGSAAASPGRTDANGYYRIAGLSPGTASVVAVSPSDGQRFGRVAAMRVAETTRLDITFGRGTSVIEGRVITNVPGARCSVVLFSEAADNPLGAEGDAEGRYRIENVPAGQARLRGTCDGPEGGGRARTVELEVQEGQTLQADIDLTSTFDTRVAGTVTGAPADSQMMVFVQPGAFEVPVAQEDLLQAALDFSQTAAAGAQIHDGSFEVSGVDPGEYTVVAVALANAGPGTPNAVRMVAVPVTVQEATPVSVVLDFTAP